jgi:hypothetical protein
MKMAEPHTAADGGTAACCSSVVQSEVEGGSAPTAERGRSVAPSAPYRYDELWYHTARLGRSTRATLWREATDATWKTVARAVHVLRV